MDEKEQRRIFAKNLNYQIANHGKKQNEVAKDLNVSPTSLNNWCRGVSMPTVGKIQTIADYFNVGKTTLLDEPDETVDDGVKDAVVLRKLHQLTEANYNVIISTIDAMLKSQEAL